MCISRNENVRWQHVALRYRNAYLQTKRFRGMLRKSRFGCRKSAITPDAPNPRRPAESANARIALQNKNLLYAGLNIQHAVYMGIFITCNMRGLDISAVAAREPVARASLQAVQANPGLRGARNGIETGSGERHRRRATRRFPAGRTAHRCEPQEKGPARPLPCDALAAT
jgi:hypothetical protein